ncbi:tyrosine-type recombinase/integrase [Leucobacter sp.]
MAWTEQLPSGRYRGGYRIPGGQKRYTPDTYAHKKRAQTAAAALETEAQQLGWRDPRAAERTWGEWCEEWLTARYVEASTMRRDESRINTRLLPKWGETRLVDITRQAVKQWAVELKADGLAPQSVKRALALFSTSLNAAVDAEVLAANPAARLGLKFPTNENERVLTPREKQKLFRALGADDDATAKERWEAERDQAFAAVLFGAGPRWGEAVALTPEHFNFERKEIRWRQAWDSHNRILVAYTKGKKRRTTPIADWVIEIVRPVVERTPPGHYVFATTAGTPLDYSNWHRRSWSPAVARAKLNKTSDLDPVTIHTTRHTYATEQLEDGRSLAEIADLLGHASISTTERYAHRRSKVAAEAADAVPDPRNFTPKPKKSKRKKGEAGPLPDNVVAFPGIRRRG